MRRGAEQIFRQLLQSALAELSDRGTTDDLEDGDVDLELLEEPGPDFDSDQRIDTKLDKRRLGIKGTLAELQDDAKL